MPKKQSSLANKKFLLILIISLLIVYSTAVIGSLFTSNQVNSEWYQEIRPSITPPNYVFPIVWNILYLLISISIALSYYYSKNKKDKIKISFLFGVNLLLNILWSYSYFQLHNVKLAFFIILLILASIILLLYKTHKINKLSSYLLIPYLLWILFATLLNWLSI